MQIQAALLLNFIANVRMLFYSEMIQHHVLLQLCTHFTHVRIYMLRGTCHKTTCVCMHVTYVRTYITTKFLRRKAFIAYQNYCLFYNKVLHILVNILGLFCE